MDGTVELGAKIAEVAFVGVNIDDMPAEMLHEIINNASPESAFSLSRTGRRYRQAVNQKKNKICEEYLNNDKIKEICTTSNDATHKWCRETSNLCGKIITNFTQLINLGNDVYRIPDGVVVIAKKAFEDEHKIGQIIIPDSVTEIGERAFWCCISLISVTIPDSVMEIEDLAFAKCTSLTSVTIPDSVTEIGYGAFYRCKSLTSVTIPDSVTEIGESAFEHCTNLASVSIPGSLEDIGYFSFPYHTTIIRRN